MSEKMKNLTDEQVKEIFALNTAEEVIDYGKKHGIEIPQEEAEKIAATQPDDLLDDVAGGGMKIQLPTMWMYLTWNCPSCGEPHGSRTHGTNSCQSCGWTGTL